MHFLKGPNLVNDQIVLRIRSIYLRISFVLPARVTARITTIYMLIICALCFRFCQQRINFLKY